MSYDQKVQAARTLLETHNAGIENESDRVDIDKFIACLKSSGGTTEATLGASTWEDLENCGIPRILARQVANLFRAKKEKSEVKYIRPGKAKAMSNKELIERFDPNEPGSAVGEVLDDRAKGKAFLIISEGKVLVEPSLDLLCEIVAGHSPRDIYLVDGIPNAVYAVGEKPDQLVEINPLWTNEELRPNGDCTNINKSWKSVPLRVRQLIYLGRSTGELVLNSTKDAVDYHNAAVLDNAFETFTSYAPKAMMKFKELEDRGELPSLRRKLVSASGRAQDPFHGSGYHKKF